MKRTTSMKQKNASLERKNEKHSEKATKLDRKSSRGMIYENEELRLRTININAEVERGQSDIKRLRRENEHLRREIWTLRDECDRLNKRFKAKLVENSHDHGGCTARASGGSAGCPGRRGSCDSNSEDSDSCDTCKGRDDDLCLDDYKYTPNDCCIDGSCKLPPANGQHQQPASEDHTASLNNLATSQSAGAAPNSGDHQQLLAHFDHLSIVSEETLSNSEVLAASAGAGNQLSCTPNSSGSPSALPALLRPLTPLAPIELVANELHDLQTAVPPLSYFENIVQQHMSPATGNTSESAQTTNSGKTVIQTNGWDYSLQSPFSQPKLQHNSPSSQSTATLPLSTFVPTSSFSPHYTAEQPPASQEPTVDTSTGAPSANSPKHFFAPLKPHLKINTTLANRNPTAPVVPQPPVAPQKYNPPDVFVANALASPYQRPGEAAPSETTAAVSASQPVVSAFPQRPSPQTDSANLEAILNDIEAISEDILAIQLEKNKAHDKLNKAISSTSVISATQSPKYLEKTDRNKKPYRSEMNLLLSYDGANTTITPTTCSSTVYGKETPGTPVTNTTAHHNNAGYRARARSLEREHPDSPSPNVPDPMAPFPSNRSYIGFDPLSAAAVGTTKPPLPPPPPRPATPTKPVPPTPPARKLATSPIHNRSGSPGQALSPQQQQQLQQAPPLSVLTPNKSRLYAAIANAAAARRAQFRATPSHLTRSLDADELITSPTEEEAQAAEASRRKARRVSIVCGDSSKENSNGQEDGPRMTTMTTATLGSCGDLLASNPAIMNLKQTSHSTPNSPHSVRRGSIGLVESPGAVTSPHYAPPGRRSTHQSHQRGSSLFAPHRKCSQDSARGTSAAIADLAAAAAAAVASRSRCSRRSSDATVASGRQRISCTSGRHHHQHSHHHHQHQHSSSLISNNAQHSHHLRQDSNHETGTSLSDRNSNSMTSSGDSSASFSLPSQRRKISISSHVGGKIPWCACWGNGCL